MFPMCLLFGLELFHPSGWGQIFPKQQPPGEFTLIFIPWDLPPPMFCFTVSHGHPLLSQETLQDSQIGLTQILMESLLCPEAQCTWHPCVPSKRGLCFPQSCSAPVLKPHWPLIASIPGALPPNARPLQAGEFDMGLGTLTPMGKLLRYSYIPVCGLPTRQVWDCLYHKITPPTILIWLLFLSLSSFQSILVASSLFCWQLTICFVDGCSTVSYNIVFVGGGELESFYSATLSLSQDLSLSTFKTLCTINKKYICAHVTKKSTPRTNRIVKHSQRRCKMKHRSFQRFHPAQSLIIILVILTVTCEMNFKLLGQIYKKVNKLGITEQYYTC